MSSSRSAHYITKCSPLTISEFQVVVPTDNVTLEGQVIYPDPDHFIALVGYQQPSTELITATGNRATNNIVMVTTLSHKVTISSQGNHIIAWSLRHHMVTTSSHGKHIITW